MSLISINLVRFASTVKLFSVNWNLAGRDVISCHLLTMKTFHRRLGKKSRRSSRRGKGMEMSSFSLIWIVNQNCFHSVAKNIYEILSGWNNGILYKHHLPNVLSDFLILSLFNSSKFSLYKKSRITRADHFWLSDNLFFDALKCRAPAGQHLMAAAGRPPHNPALLSGML